MDAMAAQQAMSAAHMQALAPAGMPPLPAGMGVALPQLNISAPQLNHMVSNEQMAQLMAAAAMPQQMAMAEQHHQHHPHAHQQHHPHAHTHPHQQHMHGDQNGQHGAEGGEQLSYDTEDVGSEGMHGGRLGRKHGNDRRPLRFWQPFNDWWRADLERLERRPNAAEIEAWYNTNSDKLWGDQKPTLQETRVHAKCLRSLPLVRDYFRNYRLKKKTRHGDDGEELMDTEQGTPDDGMGGMSQGGVDTDDPSAGDMGHSRARMAGAAGARKPGVRNDRKRAAPEPPGMQLQQHMDMNEAAAAAQLAALGKMDLVAAGAAMTPVEMMNLPNAAGLPMSSGFWPQPGMDPARMHEENEYNRAVIMQQLQHAAVMQQQQQMALAAIAHQYPAGQFPAGVAMMPGQEMEDEDADTDDEADPAAAAAAAAAEAAAAAGMAHAEAQDLNEAAAAAVRHHPDEQYVQQLRHYEEQQRLEQQHLAQQQQQQQQQHHGDSQQHHQQDQPAGHRDPQPQQQQPQSVAEAHSQHQQSVPEQQHEQQEEQQQALVEQDTHHQQHQEQPQAAAPLDGDRHAAAVSVPMDAPAAHDNVHLQHGSHEPLQPGVDDMEGMDGGLHQVPAVQHDVVAVQHDPMVVPADQPQELMDDMAAAQQAQQEAHAQALAEQQRQQQQQQQQAALMEQQHVVPEVALVGEPDLAVMTKEQLADHIRAVHEELLNKRALLKRSVEQLQHTKEKLAKKKRRLQTATARNRQYQQVLMAWQASLVPLDPALASMTEMYQAQAAAAQAAAAHHAAAHAHAVQTVPQGHPQGH